MACASTHTPAGSQAFRVMIQEPLTRFARAEKFFLVSEASAIAGFKFATRTISVRCENLEVSSGL